MKKYKPLTEDDFFKIPEYDGYGIYAIICMEDFSCYVGSTSNIKRRASSHKSTLKAGTHQNRKLQQAHDEKKILRFVMLSDFDYEPSKDLLLLLEYLYMLEMNYKGFKLFNEVPRASFRTTQTEELKTIVLGKLNWIAGASQAIDKSIKKEWGEYLGCLRNAKEREWSARWRIEKSHHERMEA